MDAGSEGKTLAWTEEAKFQFLLRIVAQLKEDGRTIKWEKINIPGRTTKSLQNMWGKIKKEVSDLEKAQENGEIAATPTKTPSKRTPRAKKSQPIVHDDDDDDEDMLEQKTPSKKRARGGNTPSSSGKRMKMEDGAVDFVQSLKKEEDDGEDLLSADEV